MKRIRRVMGLVIPAIKHSNGIINLSKRIVRLYRLEGYAGIKRGLGIVASSEQITPSLNSGEHDRNDYTEWICRYDTLTNELRCIMQARMDIFAHKPLISVVMPTYNPKAEWLIAAIESVRKQIYPHWELCIADDASTDKAIRPILEQYAREDTRIKVAFREQNGHISAASNSALELTTGEWIALLDHDDLLAEHALFWVADTINKNSEARLIYSDEDKIDENGVRLHPYFKCDWNPDLFYSHNMFSHLGIYHSQLVRQVGGFRIGLEGSQDYDLALRCIEQVHIKPEHIYHIPKVLYHWRVHAESTASSSAAKPYAMIAGEHAINEHLERQGINAKAELMTYSYRVRYALPDVLPLVSLIIPTRNGLNLLRQCMDSILSKTTYTNYEILIVDNGSDEPITLDYLNVLAKDSRIRVVRDSRPFNYSALNNAAVKLARGKLIGLLNNDVEVITPGWLSEMVAIALQPGVGAVGARLWFPDKTLQHAGVILGLGLGRVAGHAHRAVPETSPGYFGRAGIQQSFSAVTAACLLVQKAIYEQVDGLDETELQIAFNDIDFCLRVREMGYRNVWTPYAELYHYESATRGLDDTPEKQARFAKESLYMKQRWGDLLLNDPAYSPNLTLDHDDFSLAWPPRVELLA
ncbi:MAG: glycosyltransferase family 2 protein [Burkholderiales bacterium]